MSREGVYNLAHYSFFTVGSRNPPMLCISVGPRESDDLPMKDTLDNARETGEFVVNIVFLALSNTMYESSKAHPPGADEFEKAGLNPVPCEVVATPRVDEAGVSMECVLHRILPCRSVATTSSSAAWSASTSATSSTRTAAYTSMPSTL